MKEAALPYQITIDSDRYPLCDGQSFLRDRYTVRNDIRGAPGIYQYLLFPHKSMNNTTLPTNCNHFAVKKRVPGTASGNKRLITASSALAPKRQQDIIRVRS